LTPKLHGRAIVRVQSPFRLSERDLSQPDIALLRPRAGRQYRQVLFLDREASIAPLAFPDLLLPLGEVVP
jgi:hypothetical protein